jgi:hypothetical protein
VTRRARQQVAPGRHSHLTRLPAGRCQDECSPCGAFCQGLNVRNRAKELSALLANPDRIREERAKAKANKEKYKGLSKAAAMGGWATCTRGQNQGIVASPALECERGRKPF